MRSVEAEDEGPIFGPGSFAGQSPRGGVHAEALEVLPFGTREGLVIEEGHHNKFVHIVIL